MSTGTPTARKWPIVAFAAEKQQPSADRAVLPAPATRVVSRIVVSIGQQRVGLADPGVTNPLNAVVATAALRAELPWTVGRLNRRKLEPRYVLDFPRPADSDSQQPG